MEEKIVKEKIVKVKDLENTLYFKIKLFGALEGIEFMDKTIQIINSKNSLSIKPFLDDLFKLCIPLDAMGIKPISSSFSLSEAGAMFQNPLSIFELGFEVLKLQEVFLKDSETFRPLIKKVESLFNTKLTESVI